MTVALFIDVDRNLTARPIQASYAEMLGCDDAYQDLEQAFEENRLTSMEFGSQLVALFRTEHFTKIYAREGWASVPLQPWVDEMLGLPVDTFLVSSGPNYYIDHLAEKYSIPPSRILCSTYDFDSSGLILRCSRPVSAATKARFVQQNQQQRQYSLTVGIGDSLTHDGPFIGHCHLGILTQPNEEFLHAQSFDCVVNLVRGLATGSGWTKRVRPSVFIGCSTESTAVATAIQAELACLSEPAIWSQGVFRPSETTIEGLERILDQFDFAIFVMAADDQAIVRGEEIATVRDNVVLEVGLFMGRLGRDRCFLLRPSDKQTRVPSDLAGVNYVDYDADRQDLNLRAAVAPAMVEISAAITRLGRRSVRL